MRSIASILLVLIFAFSTGVSAADSLGCNLVGEAIAGGSRLSRGGLTADFRGWLNSNDYGAWVFPRDDIEGGSYGGRSVADEPIRRRPVVFVHGNSDRAVGSTEEGPIGWTTVIRRFRTAGYSDAELYATTWGPANPSLAAKQTHSVDYVRRIRNFIEAVVDYTGAKQVDILAHSMGVTLARRAILGGEMDGFALGAPLTHRIDTFIGISGANLGLAVCFMAESKPTCSDEDGFFPGYPTFFGVVGESDFLSEVNARPGYEGRHVYSIWSRVDQLVGFGGLVYGRYTSRIPGQDGEMVYQG